nr:hypothetical protein [Streptococcus equi]
MRYGLPSDNDYTLRIKDSYLSFLTW